MPPIHYAQISHAESRSPILSLPLCFILSIFLIFYQNLWKNTFFEQIILKIGHPHTKTQNTQPRLREEFFRLSAKLPCERFIVRDNECRLVQRRYNICHRECLSRAHYTEQCLKLIFFFKSRSQHLDCLQLISG